jgi:hypothetical protein
MFLLLLCRKKNPEILNIAGHALLEDAGIEGITYPSRAKGKNIRTFRDALGFDHFGTTAGNGRKKLATQPTAEPTTQEIVEPTMSKQPSGATAPDPLPH